MTTRRLYLYRHGQTEWNREGRLQGHLDVPLNDTGREQARRLIPHLARLGVRAFLSSDLARAEETARIAAVAIGAPVFRDAGLREIFFGELQGLTRDEVEARKGIHFSEKMRHLPLSDQELLDMGAETGSQVLERAMRALQRFFTENPEFESVAVVSHGGVMRRLLMHFSRGTFPPAIPNGALYPVLHAGGDHWELMPTLPIP